jgi:NAD(P)-dependent dehydrogenase (short-subunit alcohol dehydrogenase family)
VVTGGTWGLGRALVVWLAKHGARNIAVVSRSGESAMRSPRWAVALDEVRGLGARIFICKCDVGDKSDLQAALGRLAQEGAPPVRGVIHGAAVFKVS